MNDRANDRREGVAPGMKCNRRMIPEVGFVHNDWGTIIEGDATRRYWNDVCAAKYTRDQLFPAYETPNQNKILGQLHPRVTKLVLDRICINKGHLPYGPGEGVLKGNRPDLWQSIRFRDLLGKVAEPRARRTHDAPPVRMGMVIVETFPNLDKKEPRPHTSKYI